ncbi:hypothetical protein SAMN04488527_1486 [Aliiroseovarius crassostreae]|nr:hypothetical protein SAMN04488527_1486 [Aliiroseovarius crassostreae]
MGKVSLAQCPAGLLTRGSKLDWPSRGAFRRLPSGMFSVAHRLQLRGQSRNWRLLATPHRIPYCYRRASARAEPITGSECQITAPDVKMQRPFPQVAIRRQSVASLCKPLNSNEFESPRKTGPKAATLIRGESPMPGTAAVCGNVSHVVSRAASAAPRGPPEPDRPHCTAATSTRHRSQRPPRTRPQQPARISHAPDAPAWF